MPDYTAMSDWDAYQACGPDATKWAAWFCQCAKARGEQADEGLMRTWFANAMMAMCDHIQPEQSPVRLPDGSAFVVM